MINRISFALFLLLCREFDDDLKSIMNPKPKVDLKKLQQRRQDESNSSKVFKNEEITSETVKVSDGENFLGIMPLKEAIALARQSSKDLLQLSNLNPPFCRIMKFSDYMALQRMVITYIWYYYFIISNITIIILCFYLFNVS